VIEELLKRFDDYDRTARLKWVGPYILTSNGLIKTPRGFDFYEYRNYYFRIKANSLSSSDHVKQFCKKIDYEIETKVDTLTPEERLRWIRLNAPLL